MKEKTRTQHKYFIVKLKKTLHLTTAIAFCLQQVVPYSFAFAMSDDEGDDVREERFVSPPTPVPNLTIPNDKPPALPEDS